MVISRLENLHTFGRTAIYDSTISALKMTARGRHRKRVIVLVTDGSDTASSSTLQEVIDAACKADVAIYCVGIGQDVGNACQ
jgi:Ca-activated chloride channel family protein